tara:strand:- start:158 stop:445 length:288 start_codon:yes stop_codon:yes gene_type:complete
MRKLFKKTTVYVVRCDSQNNFQDSAPCEKCLGTMLDLNIKRVVFSGKNNTFISASPNEITINHISAGNKFIKNKENSIENVERESNKKYKKINKQ